MAVSRRHMAHGTGSINIKKMWTDHHNVLGQRIPLVIVFINTWITGHRYIPIRNKDSDVHKSRNEKN